MWKKEKQLCVNEKDLTQMTEQRKRKDSELIIYEMCVQGERSDEGKLWEIFYT